MIRNGARIRLTRAEKDFLQGLVAEPINPQTVDEYNAWLDLAMRDLSDFDPEERLFRATLEQMRIEG